MSNVDDDTIEILARQRRREVPPKVHHVQRRVLGIEMLPLLLTATALGLALSIVLLLTGHLIAAIVLFVLTIVLGVFLRTGIRHEPDSEISRASVRANDRTRSRLHVGTVAARAWSRAAPSLVRARWRELRLRRLLRGQLQPLGEAVYRNEAERAEAIKAQAAALERELVASRRKADAAVAAARGEIARERALVGPTESLRVPGD